MIRIQLLSDFHSRKDKKPDLIKADCDLLIFAGDMGDNYQVEGNYRSIIKINGNHEYYRNKEKKCHAIKSCNEWVFVSCTLWTNFWNKTLSPLEQNYVQTMINDFKYINFTIEDCIKCFKRDISFIEKQIKRFYDKKIVICSHFAPSRKAIEKKYEGNILNSYFVNDLDNFIKDNKNIKYWLFGHVHSSHDFMIEQCRCIANARGHFNCGSYENKNFKENLIITI